MKVVDASALLPALIDDAEFGDLARRALRDERISAPELIDIEIVSALRSAVLAGAVDLARANDAVGRVRGLAVARHTHRALVSRVWELRGKVTAYDASYVALAETLRCPLVTADRRLASAPGIRCSVEVLGSGT